MFMKKAKLDWRVDKKEDGRSPTEVESERPSLLLWRQEIEAKASRPEWHTTVINNRCSVKPITDYRLLAKYSMRP